MMITVQVQDKGKTSFYIFSSFKITIFFLGITDQITDIRILDGTTKITSQEGINVTMIMNQEGTNVIINKLIVMILKIPEILQDLVDRADIKATEMMTSLMIDLFTFYIIRDRRTFTTKFMLYRRQKLCLYLSDLKE